MISESLEQIKLRKNFYRDCFHRAIKILWFSCILIAALIALIIFFALTRPEASYYATSAAGKITKLTALRQPNYSPTPLIP